MTLLTLIVPEKTPDEEGWNTYVRDCADKNTIGISFDQSKAKCPYKFWQWKSRQIWLEGWHEAREFDDQENG